VYPSRSSSPFYVIFIIVRESVKMHVIPSISLSGLLLLQGMRMEIVTVWIHKLPGMSTTLPGILLTEIRKTPHMNMPVGVVHGHPDRVQRKSAYHKRCGCPDLEGSGAFLAFPAFFTSPSFFTSFRRAPRFSSKRTFSPER